MKKRIVKKEEIEFYDSCPHCNREIKGRTSNQVNYNMHIHIKAKHKRKKKK